MKVSQIEEANVLIGTIKSLRAHLGFERYHLGYTTSPEIYSPNGRDYKIHAIDKTLACSLLTAIIAEYESRLKELGVTME